MIRIQTASKAPAVLLLLIAGSAAAQDPEGETPSAGVPEVLTLGWAVDAALAHYPAVGAARAGVESALAGGRGARSAWWPSLTVGGNYTHFQFPMLVRPLHELDAAQIIFDNDPIQGQVFADWLVFDGGERRARIRRADAAAEGAGAGLAATEMGVIEGTVGTYLQVRTLREILGAQEAQVRALDAERDRAQLLFDAGRAPRVELLRAEAALSQAQAELASIAAMLRASEDQLARLVGMQGTEVSDRDLSEVRPGSSRQTPGAPEAPADSLHPVLRQSWSRVLEAGAVHSEAKASWFPDLGLSAGARQYGAPGLDFANEWQVGLSLSYPLFTGFRRTHQIEAAEAQLGVAREQHRLRRFEVAQELDEAQAALQEANARVTALEGAVEQFTEVARIEALALEAGAGVQRDFLDAQAALFQNQAGLAQARNARVFALVRQAAALGVLDTSWLLQNLESER